MRMPVSKARISAAQAPPSSAARRHRAPRWPRARAAQAAERGIEGARFHPRDLLEIEEDLAQGPARVGTRRAVGRNLDRIEPRTLFLHRQAVRRPERGERRCADVGGELLGVGARHAAVDRFIVDEHPRTAVPQPALEKADDRLVLVRVAGDDDEHEVGDGEERFARQAIVFEDAVEVRRIDQHQHGRQTRLFGGQELGRIGRRVQRRVGGDIGRKRPQAKARQRRLGAQLGQQDRMRGADQTPRRAAGGHRGADRLADQGIEQRRFAGVVRADDARDDIGIAPRRARQQVALQQIGRQRRRRHPVAHRLERIARAAERRREITAHARSKPQMIREA